MKASLPVSILALILSTASLIRSCRTPATVDQEQVQIAASEALKVREKEFVEDMKPRFQMMFAEMGDEFDKEWNPETINELIEPLTRIINDMNKQ